MRRPVRDALRKRLTEAAVEKGADPDKVAAAIAEIESDRPLIDWLSNGGFEKLLKLLLELIALI